MARRLIEELCYMDKMYVVAVFWDIMKFYDMLSLVLLMSLAVESGFFLELLAVEILWHVCPRLVKVAG